MCPEKIHWFTKVAVAYEGSTWKWYLLDGLPKISTGNLIVIKDSGKRAGRKVLWEIQE